MVKDHSDSERGYPLPLHGLLFLKYEKVFFFFQNAQYRERLQCVAERLLNLTYPEEMQKKQTSELHIADIHANLQHSDKMKEKQTSKRDVADRNLAYPVEKKRTSEELQHNVSQKNQSIKIIPMY